MPPASAPHASASRPHTWTFFRTGGIDQIALNNGEDLRRLETLDQKLWVALSCPVKGLEIDEKTLALIDTDGDGRIRAPELIAAVNWASARLKNPGDLLAGSESLALSEIDTSSAEGAILESSARQILRSLGKGDDSAITTADAANTAAIFSASVLNGSGIIPPAAAEEPAVQALIKDIITCLGGTASRNGATGITAAQIDAFFKDLAAYTSWVEQSGTKEIAVLGDATAAACNAIKALRPKVEDYFARCRMAAFDPRAIEALSRSESEYLSRAAEDMRLSAEEIAEFPLARIAANQQLPLFEGVNPAWAEALAHLHERAVTPVFGAEKTSLSAEEWRVLGDKFAPYETWLGDKAGSAVEKLGLARAKEILAGEGRAALAALVAKDKSLEPEFRAISDVERLARYHRDLRDLLHNFINFADFFARDRLAVFQAGTLFLDGRSCELCLRVEDPARHAALAAMSKAYIAYVDCVRPGGEKMQVAACFTQGDSDYLFVGRHGIFYDRKGRDWDATITRLIDNPISVRQAFWSPYKKFVRFVEEQVAKRAAAADTEATSKLENVASSTVNTVASGKPVARAGGLGVLAGEGAGGAGRPKFEVGTVAALGVGLGAIGTLLGGLVAGFLGLGVWMPLGVLGIVLAISGPSMLIAWIKLRQRNLGPILDANGWAINGRVKISVPFGTALTDQARLPKNARRLLRDPYARKNRALRVWAWAALGVVVLGAVATRVDRHRRGHYFWQAAPTAPAVAAPPAPAVSSGPAEIASEAEAGATPETAK
ncbi:hypothetical protein AXK11_08890 [Cephaloticoccus primus]|uniref:EF-hand domain-containing protein n=1 Tax=Cephaloticoccus primus TaxID=1548207 RepID=A0A139SHU7_9BACT|nr:hypothetical protein [Cephaloticoccus primus]KXU34148.1 hypothetical protein AXK11_08890 [Cephaloticoccus primus]